MSNDTSRAGTQRLVFHGQGGELFVTFLVNTVLKVVTLGIYHFWAKTRVRRYLWTQTSFDGEHFEYTGQGKELLIGFLKFVALLIVASIAAALIGQVVPEAVVVMGAILVILAPVIVGAGLYGAMRYKLTRTKLRGIRFGLEGSAWEHGAKIFGYTLLIVLTLTLYSPFARMKLAAHTLNNTRFGDRAFSFTGKGSDLFGSYVLALLLVVPTLGLASFWYLGKELRYRAEHTRLDGLSFAMDVNGKDLFLFWLGNVLLLLVTLGLAFPWVICRAARFAAERTRVDGSLDYDRILQAQQASSATGEGLVGALDLGMI